jgi:hypothetical protein
MFENKQLRREIDHKVDRETVEFKRFIICTSDLILEGSLDEGRDGQGM